MPKNAQITVELHSFHIAKIKLKILQVRLHQYMNWEPPDVQAGFRKGRETRDQIAYVCWITEKARQFQKHIYFSFNDYAKAFDYVNHGKLENSEMGIPDHLSCLLRNLYAGQAATVRNGLGTTDWFKVGKGAHQCCVLSPCLFNLYTEYIMWNARLMTHKLESRLPGKYQSQICRRWHFNEIKRN